MELENLHLLTIMEVADARGSHQRMLRLVLGGLMREDIAVISEHLPMKFWSIVKVGGGDFKVGEPERHQLDQAIKVTITKGETGQH